MFQHKWLIGLIIVLILVAVACGSAGQQPQPIAAEAPPQPTATSAPAEEAGGEARAGEPELPEVNPLELEGGIIAAGSSTVFPLAEAMAERFQDEGFAGNITIDMTLVLNIISQQVVRRYREVYE